MLKYYQTFTTVAFPPSHTATHGFRGLRAVKFESLKIPGFIGNALVKEGGGGGGRFRIPQTTLVQH